MGQIKFVISLMLIALFSVTVITFAINFASENDAAITLEDDTDFINIQTDLKENATTFYSDVETSADALDKSTVSTQTEATEGGTSFKVGPWTALGMARTAISSGFNKIFGSDSGFSIFFTALISMLGFMTVLYIYKAWAGRNPD